MESLSQVHWEVISPVLRELLLVVGKCHFTHRFYLAGGTALALQIGHRQSDDLDFFSQADILGADSRQEVIRALNKTGLQVVEAVDGNLVLAGEQVRVGFFSYAYPLLNPAIRLENGWIASILDIGLMKLDAVAGRGSRKDFYDLYAIVQLIPLDRLLESSALKYPGFRDFALTALEYLVNFENAERDFQPRLLIGMDWSEVRRFFIDQARQMEMKWFGRE